MSYSEKDSNEAKQLLTRYIEHLQKNGKMGRRTIADMGKFLKYKDAILDRRYVKAVLFPEYSKGARIPAPHTVGTGIWKTVTEFVYSIPNVEGAGGPKDADIGWIVDIELGAPNAQKLYIYEMDKGFFKNYPSVIVNGNGVRLNITAESGEVDPTFSANSLDFAALDPTSLYPRYRLVGAACTVLPLIVKNPNAEINMAQSDDFDLPLKGVVQGSGDIAKEQVFINYLTAPFVTVRDLVSINPNGPFVHLPVTNPVVVYDIETAKLSDIFGDDKAKVSEVEPAIGSNVGWSAVIPRGGVVKQAGAIWGEALKLKNVTDSWGAFTEQQAAQVQLANNNSEIVYALAALAHIAPGLKIDLPAAVADGLTKMAAIKAMKAKGVLEQVRDNCSGVTDILDIIISMIQSMFPYTSVPKARPRRQLTKAKLQECSYQTHAMASQGIRMIYLPRSARCLQYRDIQDILRDLKKDVFWGVTSGLQTGDSVKFIIITSYEGIPNSQFVKYLPIIKVTPDAKTLETIDKIASISPEIITIDPMRLEAVYTEMKAELSYLIDKKAEAGMVTQTRENMAQILVADATG